MAIRHKAARAQVKTAVWDEVDRVGRDAFRASIIVSDFSGLGVDRATLFRWVRAELHANPPERVLGRSLAALGALKVVEPGQGAADQHLDHLRLCVDAAADVMRVARGEDGSVKNPRILLAAADQMRQAIDVASRVARDGAREEAVMAFVAAVADQIRLAPPSVAMQVSARLKAMTTGLAPASAPR